MPNHTAVTTPTKAKPIRTPTKMARDEDAAQQPPGAQLDEFDAQISSQMAEKEAQLADMATLAQALADGQHADAEASAERYEVSFRFDHLPPPFIALRSLGSERLFYFPPLFLQAIRAAFEALTASSDAYRADLEAAIEREELALRCDELGRALEQRVLQAERCVNRIRARAPRTTRA